MFEIDRKGLSQILTRRGYEFAMFELVQNALDENTTTVRVIFEKPRGSRVATITVEDDNPAGFADIRDAYTLFASSKKKTDPTKRGRFNIGEKLVIAACEESRIITTTAAFEFVGNERRTLRRRTRVGSIFEGTIRMTSEQFEDCCAAMHQLIPPDGVQIIFNNEFIPPRVPIAVVKDITLRTERADEDGYLRPSSRQTEIRIYQPQDGEPGMLYELGIPVVPTGDDYHADVQQKVPLAVDRTNVPPSFLRTVRAAVLNKVHERINPEQSNHTWVQDALANPDVSSDAVRSVIEQRFGDKAVSYDPSDRESNKRAVAAGYNVVHGRSLSGAAWENVRKAGALIPAGKVTPSPKPYDPDGEPYKILTPSDQEARVIEGIRRIARALIGHQITVHLTSEVGIPAAATYGKGCVFVLNKVKLGNQFFTNGISEDVVDLTIHELGHEYESDHLSTRYYHALTKLGARLAFAVKADPTLLDLEAS